MFHEPPDGRIELCTAEQRISCEACEAPISRGATYAVYVPRTSPQYELCLKCGEELARGRLECARC